MFRTVTLPMLFLVALVVCQQAAAENTAAPTIPGAAAPPTFEADLRMVIKGVLGGERQILACSVSGKIRVLNFETGSDGNPIRLIGQDHESTVRAYGFKPVMLVLPNDSRIVVVSEEETIVVHGGAISVFHKGSGPETGYCDVLTMDMARIVDDLVATATSD